MEWTHTVTAVFLAIGWREGCQVGVDAILRSGI